MEDNERKEIIEKTINYVCQALEQELPEHVYFCSWDALERQDRHGFMEKFEKVIVNREKSVIFAP